MRAAVVGANGYAGQELSLLLDGHAAFETTLRMRGREGMPAVGEVGPLDSARFGEVDVVFLCTPHGVATPLARIALDAGTKVVDLSAEFRLKDPEIYASTYGAVHAAPDLLDAAVYGLTEHARMEVSSARLVANPGCFPTAVCMPLLPLLSAGIVEPQTAIVADCKSGVSGAGAAPSEGTRYGQVHENAWAYKIGEHRHAPEIRQVTGTDAVVFVPHLLPCFRGILATLYLTPATGADAASAREVLRATYADEAFVDVLDTGTPDLRQVQRSNHCAIGVADAFGQIVVISVLDNLVKGAAGQALQNANLALGLEEGLGLA